MVRRRRYLPPYLVGETLTVAHRYGWRICPSGKERERAREIPAEISLYNSGKHSVEGEVEVSLYAPNGSLMETRTTKLTVKALQENIARLQLSVSNPELWSPDTPTLYKVKSVVRQNGKVTDEVTTRCGFRTIRFDKDTGFWLNGENIKIKGVCNHQDHAGVGVAMPDALWEFRLRKLKEMGVNAYRAAHNPTSKEFMALCDSMGIMVLDENRLFNTSPEYVRQLQWLVRRDRNCPSVILWSVFNEEPMRVRRMVMKWCAACVPLSRNGYHPSGDGCHERRIFLGIQCVSGGGCGRIQLSGWQL